jgi:Protein of unknown function (DUF3040)
MSTTRTRRYGERRAVGTPVALSARAERAKMLPRVERGDIVPLSEEEQRILRQIEEQLQRDPNFRASTARARGGSRRTAVLAVTGTVVCLALAVILLAVSPYLSFVVFLGAIALGFLAERHLKVLGEHGLANLEQSVRNRARRDDIPF